MQKGKETGRLVYVATPYTGLRCSEISRRAMVLNIARDECKKIKKAGYTPVSPVLLWDGVYDESADRDEVIRAGISLMEVCNYCYFSKHPDAQFSGGMKLEKEYALKIGLTELDFSGGEVGAALPFPN